MSDCHREIQYYIEVWDGQLMSVLLQKHTVKVLHIISSNI